MSDSKRVSRSRHAAGIIRWGARSLLAASIAAFHVTDVQAAIIVRTTAYDYDSASGLLTKEIVEPGDTNLCLVTARAYDVWGNQSSVTSRNCNGTAGSIPGTNSEAAAPLAGSIAIFTTRSSGTNYGVDGRFPITATNALLQNETRVFDGTRGLLTQATDPNGLSTSWKYDEWGRKILEKRVDGNGTRVAYAYCSDFGFAVNWVAGTATCPTIAGVAAAYVVTTTPVKAPIDIVAGTDGGANGAYSKTYYDTLNRVIRTETQSWDANNTVVNQDTEYNNLGQPVRVSRPYLSGLETPWFATTTYDLLGRVITVTQPDGVSKVETIYGGLVTTVKDELGQATKQTRNVVGQVVAIEDAKNKVITKTYDPVGNLLTTTDSLGNVIRLRYDGRGRKDQMIDPDMGTWTYAYNALGELKKQTDAKAQTTQMAYDVLGRLTAKTQPSVNTNWYYDKYQNGTACAAGIGKLCEASATNGYNRKHYYDTVGRPKQATTVVGTTSYTSSVTYDSNGRTDKIGYPGNALTVQRIYTPLGYLQKVVNAANTATVYWQGYWMNAEGRYTTAFYGNGVPVVDDYDSARGWLTHSYVGVSNTVLNLGFTYYANGNLKTRSDANTGVNTSYVYDPLNRLQTETVLGGGVSTAQTTTWGYDDLGNITSRTGLGTYAYNPSGATSVRPHAVTGITGSVNGQSNPVYGYDNNGNLQTVKIGAATLRSVTWNSYNKADSISQTLAGTTNKLDFLYDSEGDRVREVFSRAGAVQRTTVYLNAGGLFYEEETAGGVTKKKHYVAGPSGIIGVVTFVGTSTTPSTQYWHKDNLGSTVAITNDTGALVERLAYEPFGKRRNANGTTDALGTLLAASTRRGFTGHEHDDEVGLVNMNGRVYDAAIGRFLSADPTRPVTSGLQDLNRYSYVRNAPLWFTDPFGYEPWSTTTTTDSDGNSVTTRTQYVAAYTGIGQASNSYSGNYYACTACGNSTSQNFGPSQGVSPTYVISNRPTSTYSTGVRGLGWVPGFGPGWVNDKPYLSALDRVGFFRPNAFSAQSGARFTGSLYGAFSRMYGIGARDGQLLRSGQRPGITIGLGGAICCSPYSSIKGDYGGSLLSTNGFSVGASIAWDGETVSLSATGYTLSGYGIYAGMGLSAGPTFDTPPSDGSSKFTTAEFAVATGTSAGAVLTITENGVSATSGVAPRYGFGTGAYVATGAGTQSTVTFGAPSTVRP